MRYKFLVMPRLEVRNANAQPVWWIIGAPAVTAYAGFARALTLAFGDTTHEGICIIHHDMQLLGERLGKFLPHQFRAASYIDRDDYSSKNPYVLSAQPTARCHLCVSLVLRLEEETPVDIDDVRKFLRRGRVAGGAIVAHGDVSISNSTDDAARTVRSGFVVRERQDLMAMQPTDRDMLDALLRVTDPKLRTDAAEDKKWLSPTTLGYATITPFESRRNVRGGFRHAYAEPLVGLVQYTGIRRQAPATGTVEPVSHEWSELPFWSYRNPRPNIFVVSTQ